MERNGWVVRLKEKVMERKRKMNGSKDRCSQKEKELHDSGRTVNQTNRWLDLVTF